MLNYQSLREIILNELSLSETELTDDQKLDIALEIAIRLLDQAQKAIIQLN